MGNLVVRLMAAADLIAVSELSSQLGYPVAPGELALRFAALARIDDEALFVAECDHRVRGWVHVGLHRSLEAPAAAVIWGLVVDTGSRRHGVGTALVLRAADWSREVGSAALRVRSNVERAESHPFYERLGFTRIKTQHAYELRL